ncbi:UNVERIFIED_CONTAM: hypothetical protein GTU68_027062 [Idotea baltica]|nr:hypothetical protein [Idotea baltica]
MVLSFCEGINCITGPNGVGKTNILDALHYLSFTRGFRNTQDRLAVKDGESFFFNGATLVKENKSHQVHCNFVKGKGKKILINKKPLKKMSEHIGRIPMVAILPIDTDLINGPSAGRRKLLDMLISQYNPLYLRHLIQYDKLIEQRNALLKLFGEQRFFDKDQLDIYNAQLIPHGRAIHQGRSAFLVDFEPIFQSYFHKIVNQKETPTIIYRSHVQENTEDGWKQLLSESLEKDLSNQYSGTGVHRDDLIFTIDAHSTRNYGSQGQQKTFVIALKLAQYLLLQQQTNLNPILLLDDIFDKLDEHRLQQIAQLLSEEVEGQIFITDTSLERLQGIFKVSTNKPVAFYSVIDGEVSVVD